MHSLYPFTSVGVWHTWYVISVPGNGLRTNPVPKECAGLMELVPRHAQ